MPAVGSSSSNSLGSVASASDLEPPLIAVGRMRARLSRCRRADEVEQLLGTCRGRLLIAMELRSTDDRCERPGVRPAIAANHHVLECGHVGKRPDVLECPGHAIHDLARLRWQHSTVEHHATAGRQIEPVRQLKNVVLPAPLGPINPMISPSLTRKSTESTATRPPNRIVTSSATGRVSHCLGARIGNIDRSRHSAAPFNAPVSSTSSSIRSASSSSSSWNSSCLR